MEYEEVLELLRRSEALLEGHFQLSSGLHSDRYFQCALVLSWPERAERLARALAERLDQRLDQRFDVVVGPALGAVVWAQEVARALGARAFFTERKDGRMELRRGFRVDPGARVLVVEDVVTTGGSAKETVLALRALGVEPLAVGAIVDRSGAEPFAELGLPFTSLARAHVRSFLPADCPLCAAGSQAHKPGSRPGVEASSGPAGAAARPRP